MICISLGDMAFADALSLARQARMVEIRHDLSGYDYPHLAQLIKTASRSVVTCRPGTLNDSERLDVFSFALKNGADYVDVEMENSVPFIEEVKSLTRHFAGDLIISYHNFEMTPILPELESILKHCYGLGGNVAKIATMVNNDTDITNLLSLYRKKGRKVVLGMGDKGMITRVASVPLGAEFTFAASGASETTAPGQLTEDELLEIYHILKIDVL
ncbi:MAG TPA: type I 3-dehydroquinate dehydratase [Bacteroidales bacterium]|nr:type I 3-dehydroquinate dehydratase [Bacteroidales bacterium]